MNQLNYEIINANSAEYLKTLPDNSVDSVITDPPYGINFLGKDWDKNTGEEEVYRQCLRVLKPGGHLLAFSAARTYHHLAMAVERSGFEIRDQIMWIYSSGFPKSQDVGRAIDRREKKSNSLINTSGNNQSVVDFIPNKNCPKCNKTNNGSNQHKCMEDECHLRDALKPANNAWAGWGTNLKPAHEPIVMARKPTKLSVAKNAQKWGVGALNIDATRVSMTEDDKFDIRIYKKNQNNQKRNTELTDIEYGEYEIKQPNKLGRFPANLIHDGSDQVTEMFPGSGDSSAARFFYCAKVNRNERNIGCEDIEPNTCINDGRDKTCDNAFQRGATITNNNHPTVKPVELMKYLIKLVTPTGGTVLDPFNGSGSTGMAAVELGYKYIGIDLDEKYCEISRKRIEAWYKKCHSTMYNKLFKEE